MNPQTARAFLLELDALLTDLRQIESAGMPAPDIGADLDWDDHRLAGGSATDQDLLIERIATLDKHLQRLVRSGACAEIAASPGERDALAEKLSAISQIHSSLIDGVRDQCRAIADTLQRLRHDQRSASLYDRVLRHSL